MPQPLPLQRILPDQLAAQTALHQVGDDRATVHRNEAVDALIRQEAQDAAHAGRLGARQPLTPAVIVQLPLTRGKRFSGGRVFHEN